MNEKNKLIYVCGSTEHVYEYNMLTERLLITLPHIIFIRCLVNELTEDMRFELSKALINKCDEFWLFGGEVSLEMQKEIKYAIETNKKIISNGKEELRRYEIPKKNHERSSESFENTRVCDNCNCSNNSGNDKVFTYT